MEEHGSAMILMSQKETEVANDIQVQNDMNTNPKGKRYKTLARRKKLPRKGKQQQKAKEVDKVKKPRCEQKFRQFRCNMLAFEEVFTKVCKDLGEDKEILRNELMKTPFWDFISIYDRRLVSKSTAKKSDREIQRLIDCYVPKLKKFKFGNKVAEISVSDVAQIFGLQNPKNGLNVPTPLEDSKKPVDNSVVQAFFGNEIRITKSRILDLLDAEVKVKRYGWPMRVTQLLLLHLFTTLLFASSGSTLGWSFVKCITDYDTMKKYNWAKGVRDYLLSCLTTSEDGRAHTSSGCVVLIPYWICERSTMLCEIDGRCGMTPCCVKWSLPAFTTVFKKMQVHQIDIDNAEDETNVKDNEQQGDDDFMNHPPKHAAAKPKGKKRQRAKEKKASSSQATTVEQEVGKKIKRAKKHVAEQGAVKQTLRDTVDNVVGDDDFENPPPKNGATTHDEVGKKKAARKNLKKGATAQVEEGVSVVAEKDGPAESEEAAPMVTKKGATAQAEEGASVVAEKGASAQTEEGVSVVSEKGGPTESEEDAHVVSEKGDGVQTKEGASVQLEEGATAQAEKGTLVVAEKGATAQAVEGSSGQAEEGATSEAEEDTREGLESFDMTLHGWLEGKEKAAAVDDEGETYEEATANTEEILKKFFNKDKDADQGGGHEEFASEKMYDPEDFRLYEEFVEKESREFPKATSDEELEYWQGLAKVRGEMVASAIYSCKSKNDSYVRLWDEREELKRNNKKLKKKLEQKNDYIKKLEYKYKLLLLGQKGETSEVGVTTQIEGGSDGNDVEGLGAEKVATVEGEEGSAENVATAGEEEGLAGNVEGAGEEGCSDVGGAAEREGPRTRSVVRRIKARTDRKEKKMEDFEVQIPLKRQRKKRD